MKTMQKRNVSLFMAVVLSLAVLSGCGMKPDDAKAYVQATLDASYKAEFSEYAKITDSTEEEAQKLFDENIENTTSSLGFDALGATEETMEKYRELLKEISAKVKYTVGDAKETDNGFEVEVTVEPMQIFSGLQEEFMSKLQEEVTNSDKELSEDEINQLGIDMMHELLSEKLQEAAYGEPKTLTVHVTKDSNGVWNITEGDLQAVDTALFTIQ